MHFACEIESLKNWFPNVLVPFLLCMNLDRVLLIFWPACGYILDSPPDDDKTSELL